MKVLVTGASGLLGKKVISVLSGEHAVGGVHLNVEVPNSRYLDITNQIEVAKFIKLYTPEVIVHTAAISDTNYCEENQEVAWQVNVEGTRNLVMAAKLENTKFIYISSDYVFDGENESYDTSAKPNPINYYGVTKLEGERIVKEEIFDYAIIRPGILYGYNDESDKKTFPRSIIDSLKENKSPSLDDNVYKYPVLIDDVALLISKIIKMKLGGLFHIASEQKLTRYEWASLLAKSSGLEEPFQKFKKEISVDTGKKPLNVKLIDEKLTNEMDIKPFSVVDGFEVSDKQQKCFFKLIYSVRPDKLVLDQSASKFRIDAGKALAIDNPVNADIVVPVPESGIYPATGYSSESGIPLMFGLIRDYYTKRTLYEEQYNSRINALKRKLIPVPDVVVGKKIVLIDEAIISGLTLKIVVEKLRECGAKEIHLRIPSPPMLYDCPALMMPSNIKLLAKKIEIRKENFDNKLQIEEQMKDYFSVDSIKYLSIDGLLNSTKRKEWCLYCLKGN